MDNYKIKVKDEAESKEVISLLIQLGCKDSESDRFGFVYTIGEKIGCDFLKHWEYYSSQGCKELTLPQLRDLVVLKRNDVKDANYESVDEELDDLYFKDSSGKLYRWFCGSHWTEAASYKGGIRPIKKSNDPALISGAEAYDLIGKRIEVEAYCEQIDGSFKWQDAKHLPACDILNDGFDFRLKPTTLTVNAELPKPSREFQQNTEVYAVIYEFKTREERNAFADKLRGTNT